MIPPSGICPNRPIAKPTRWVWLAVFALLAAPWSHSAPPPNHASAPDAQRNAVNAVRAQLRSLHSATQAARNYGVEGVETVRQPFDSLRKQYDVFAAALSPGQTADCGNKLAELSAGLDILQQAFGNYRQDLTDGRTVATALTDLCRVLDEGAGIWLLEFNEAVSQAHVAL
jgi:hypothetical protein